MARPRRPPVLPPGTRAGEHAEKPRKLSGGVNFGLVAEIQLL